MQCVSPIGAFFPQEMPDLCNIKSNRKWADFSLNQYRRDFKSLWDALDAKSSPAGKMHLYAKHTIYTISGRSLPLSFACCSSNFKAKNTTLFAFPVEESAEAMLLSFASVIVFHPKIASVNAQMFQKLHYSSGNLVMPILSIETDLDNCLQRQGSVLLRGTESMVKVLYILTS